MPDGGPTARSRGGELALANSWPLVGFGARPRGLSLDLALRAALIEKGTAQNLRRPSSVRASKPERRPPSLPRESVELGNGTFPNSQRAADRLQKRGARSVPANSRFLRPRHLPERLGPSVSEGQSASLRKFGKHSFPNLRNLAARVVWRRCILPRSDRSGPSKALPRSFFVSAAQRPRARPWGGGPPTPPPH